MQKRFCKNVQPVTTQPTDHMHNGSVVTRNFPEYTLCLENGANSTIYLYPSLHRHESMAGIKTVQENKTFHRVIPSPPWVFFL